MPLTARAFALCLFGCGSNTPRRLLVSFASHHALRHQLELGACVDLRRTVTAPRPALVIFDHYRPSFPKRAYSEAGGEKCELDLSLEPCAHAGGPKILGW
jgi:hypothetical protein